MKKIWYVVFEDKFSRELYIFEQKTRCRNFDHFVFASRDKKKATKTAIDRLKDEALWQAKRIKENIKILRKEARR